MQLHFFQVECSKSFAKLVDQELHWKWNTHFLKTDACFFLSMEISHGQTNQSPLCSNETLTLIAMFAFP